MTHDSKAVIAAKRAERAAKRNSRVAKWLGVNVAQSSVIESTVIDDEDKLRQIILDALQDGGKSASRLYRAVYDAYGLPPAAEVVKDRARRKMRRSIDVLLRKLHLRREIVVDSVKVAGDWQDNVPSHKRDLNRIPRTVSMIYLRPTNDIPVDRIAASVIGSVWGSSELL